MSTAARSSAEQGGLVVREAVNSMQAITVASKQIAEIIMTNDDCFSDQSAGQTNLPALNATLGAARAGEQGTAVLQWWALRSVQADTAQCQGFQRDQDA